MIQTLLEIGTCVSEFGALRVEGVSLGERMVVIESSKGGKRRENHSGVRTGLRAILPSGASLIPSSHALRACCETEAGVLVVLFASLGRFIRDFRVIILYANFAAFLTSGQGHDP